MNRERELLERAYYVLGELSYAMLKVSGEYNLAGDIYEFLSTPEPEQDEEPVAWISHNGFRFNADIEPIEHGIEVALYLHPAPRQEPTQGEGWQLREVYFHADGNPGMHREPSPRPDFVRLSEEEVGQILSSAHTPYEAVCAAENRLERKNK